MPSHVLGHGRLTHREPQLQELSVNPRGHHKGFAVESSRINARTSDATPGRPVRRRLFQVQNRRKPRRCHAMTVSGLTIRTVARQLRQACASHAQRRRSAAVKRKRRRRDRFTRASWCRSAIISRCNEARDWTTNRSEWSSVDFWEYTCVNWDYNCPVYPCPTLRATPIADGNLHT